MTGISEITEHWFGLCRKPPAVRTSQTCIGIPLGSVHGGLPSGGGGGSGTVRRGIGAALSGMRILNRNRHLLWFTLLAGLVLAGNAICQSVLPLIGWFLPPSIFELFVRQFLIELATLFCLVFLLAGLFLSISSKKEGSASFFAELAGAKKYLKPIFLWSVILALAGMLLFIIFTYFVYSPGWLPREFLFLDIVRENNLLRMISQFPFNFTLDPRLFSQLPGEGGRSLLFGISPFGFIDTLIFSAINLLLFVLTLFVVPLIVLDQKTLREAVVRSFALIRKTWDEVAACALFLGVILSGVFLTYLLVQAAYGVVTPFVTYPPPNYTWITLGLLYDLALVSVGFVVATVGGIAAQDLYISAKEQADAKIR